MEFPTGQQDESVADMKTTFWSVIATIMIVAAALSSYIAYQSGAVHNDATYVQWNMPD
ncbi:hypothetical protein [Glaciimonas soli]|uniref:hypothetical protein n=1 Tax=Glaciimonas soli TaxID=2590999 RepID=UPI001293BAB8|nr:hypothetical protein [Glaciimonas soli]